MAFVPQLVFRFQNILKLSMKAWKKENEIIRAGKDSTVNA